MKTTKVFIAMLVAAALGGCADPKEPSIDNFAKAIDQHLQGTQGGPEYAGYWCIRVSAESINRESQQLALFAGDTAAQRERIKSGKDYAVMQAMVQSGQASVEETTRQILGSSGREREQNVLLYTLTSQTSRIREEPNQEFTDAMIGTHSANICAGRALLDRVLEYTEPSGHTGMTATEAEAVIKAEGVPEWMRAEEVSSRIAGLTDALGDGRKVRATLVLKNEGWDVIHITP